jgi:hypothetical protein
MADAPDSTDPPPEAPAASDEPEHLPDVARKPFQYSLATLLGIVTAAAIVCSAIKTAPHLLAAVGLLLLVLALLVYVGLVLLGPLVIMEIAELWPAKRSAARCRVALVAAVLLLAPLGIALGLYAPEGAYATFLCLSCVWGLQIPMILVFVVSSRRARRNCPRDAP